MFGKTKRKIVFTVFFALLALIIVTMSTIYVTNLVSARGRQEDMLKTYVEQYVLENGEDNGGKQNGELPPPQNERKDPRRNQPQFMLSTFYSVAYAETGEVLTETLLYKPNSLFLKCRL